MSRSGIKIIMFYQINKNPEQEHKTEIHDYPSLVRDDLSAAPSAVRLTADVICVPATRGWNATTLRWMKATTCPPSHECNWTLGQRDSRGQSRSEEN